MGGGVSSALLLHRPRKARSAADRAQRRLVAQLGEIEYGKYVIRPSILPESAFPREAIAPSWRGTNPNPNCIFLEGQLRRRHRPPLGLRRGKLALISLQIA